MGSSLEIRAAVLHLDRNSVLSREKLEESITAFLEGTDNFIRKTNLNIIGKRLVTPPFRVSEAQVAVKLLTEVAETNGINYVGVPLMGTNAAEITELLESYPRLYTSVEYDPEEESENLEMLRKVAEKSYLQATRFAVSFGPRPETPYFPVTQSLVQGVTLSLLYVNVFRDSRPAELVNLLEKLQNNAESSWPNFLGIDYSLSPWMEQSVARLVEARSGVIFTLPGTITIIRRLNEELESISRRLKSKGFNEVMLPLAEDNRLKELAKNEQLKFSHLLNYATYCVAGLDMVVIPDSTENNILKGILRDMWYIHLYKKRTIGMRLILAPAQEGDEIDLGMFGKTPVISPLM